MRHEFTAGCLWDGNPWFIDENHECSSYGGSPCKHCHSAREVTHERMDKSTYTETVWICPRVVIAENEAGYNSTGVCLDCIVEAAQTIAPKD